MGFIFLSGHQFLSKHLGGKSQEQNGQGGPGHSNFPVVFVGRSLVHCCNQLVYCTILVQPCLSLDPPSPQRAGRAGASGPLFHNRLTRSGHVIHRLVMRTCHRQNESHGNLEDTVSEIFENKAQLSISSVGKYCHFFEEYNCQLKQKKFLADTKK